MSESDVVATLEVDWTAAGGVHIRKLPSSLTALVMLSCDTMITAFRLFSEAAGRGLLDDRYNALGRPVKRAPRALPVPSAMIREVVVREYLNNTVAIVGLPADVRRALLLQHKGILATMKWFLDHAESLDPQLQIDMREVSIVAEVME